MSYTSIQAALLAAQKGTGFDARLKEAGASDEASAVALEPANDEERAELDKAIASGLIGRTSDDRLYRNDRVASDLKESQGWIVAVVMLVAASILASGLALVISQH